MMECEICDKKRKDDVLYENERMVVMLSDEPAAMGHIQVFPKVHYTIMEEVPDELLGYLGIAANKISMMLFERLKVHGSNIISLNGVAAGQKVPHFSINVIPRRTDDGLNLDWDMKQASNESLDSMKRIISEGMAFEEPAKRAEPVPRTELISDQEEPELQESEPDSKAIVAAPDISRRHEDKKEEKKTNYWLKSLERIP